MDRLKQLSDATDAACKHVGEKSINAFRWAHRKIRRQQTAIDRLQALVDKWPKTRDGVPIFPGMTMWVLRDFGTRRGLFPMEVFSIQELHVCDCDRLLISIEDCYSTRKAAEAAGGG